jgi:hypothetical protein
MTKFHVFLLLMKFELIAKDRKEKKSNPKLSQYLLVAILDLRHHFETDNKHNEIFPMQIQAETKKANIFETH